MLIHKTVKIDESARLEIYYKEGVLINKEIAFWFDPEKLTEEDRRFLGDPDYNVPITTPWGKYAPTIRPTKSEDTYDTPRVIELLKEYCNEEDEKTRKEVTAAAKDYLNGGNRWYELYEKHFPDCVAERDRRLAERQRAEQKAEQERKREKEQAESEFREFLHETSPTTRAQVDAGYLTKSQCREEIDVYLMRKTGYKANPTETGRPTHPTIAEINAAKEEEAELQVDNNGQTYLYKMMRFAGMDFPMFKAID